MAREWKLPQGCLVDSVSEKAVLERKDKSSGTDLLFFQLHILSLLLDRLEAMPVELRLSDAR